MTRLSSSELAAQLVEAEGRYPKGSRWLHHDGGSTARVTGWSLQPVGDHVVVVIHYTQPQGSIYVELLPWTRPIGDFGRTYPTSFSEIP